MDIQCPAVVVCLAPGDTVPDVAGGHRVTAGYRTVGTDPAPTNRFDWRPAPDVGLWKTILEIADTHRGEAVVLVADGDTLDRADLRAVTLSVDSDGPRRIDTVRAEPHAQP